MITFDLTVPVEHHPHLITALRKMKPDPKFPAHKVTIQSKPGVTLQSQDKVHAVNTDETEIDAEAVHGETVRFTVTKNDKNLPQSYFVERAKTRITELLKSEGITFRFAGLN